MAHKLREILSDMHRDTIFIRVGIAIPVFELEFSAIRSGGPGGQNVNKVSTAVLLRFSIINSSLPEAIKHKLLHFPDRRITEKGDIVIKAQNHRTQAGNRKEAVERLRELLHSATAVRKRRIKSNPPPLSAEQRLALKRKRGELKKMRGRIDPENE